MKKLLLLFMLLPLSLFASKIISYNIYDRTDRVDLMITFDTPYSGVIKQSKHSKKIIIKLTNAQIESSKIKQLSTKFLQSIVLTPRGEDTQITANVPKGVHFIASKTTDGYGLRLRFTNKPLIKREKQIQKVDKLDLPTKKETALDKNYYLVISIMLFAIVILFFLQKRIKAKTQADSPWLFKENKSEKKSPQSKQEENKVSIRFQKNIDEKNSVVMIDFAQQSYLVLMGENNILLDKYVDNQPTTQEDFNAILRERHQELDEFLKVEKKSEPISTPPTEPLQSYKQKAASLIYSEES